MLHYSEEELILHHYGESRRRRRVERHLEACESCAAVSRDIARTLAMVGDVDVPERGERYGLEVWQRIRQDLPARAPAWSPGWLAAPAARSRAVAVAAAVLIVGIAAAAWLAPRAARPEARAVSDRVDTRDLALSVESELREAEQHYQRAIAGLEAITEAEQGRLDPASAATLQHSLAVVDQAIAESRAAVQADPGSASAEQSLLDGLKSKVALLQDAVALIMMTNDTHDGDPRTPGDHAVRGRG